MALNPFIINTLNAVFDFGQKQLEEKIEDETEKELVHKALDTAQELLTALVDEDPNNKDQILAILNERLNN